MSVSVVTNIVAVAALPSLGAAASKSVVDPTNFGGVEFIALAVGLNFALVGWKTFIKNIGESERGLYGQVHSALATIQDKHKGYFLSSCIPWIERPRPIRNFLWSLNYLLASVAFLLGVVLLYIGQPFWWDFLLMLPPVVQILLFVVPSKILNLYIQFVKWRCSFDKDPVPNTAEMEAKVKLLAADIQRKSIEEDDSRSVGI